MRQARIPHASSSHTFAPLCNRLPIPCVAPALSDGYGLVVVRRAMDVVNGATWLCAEDAITTLHAKLPAAPSSAAPSSLMEGKGEDETKL